MIRENMRIAQSHLKLPTSLGDDNMVGQPPQVRDLSDQAVIKQIFDLFTDEVLPLNRLVLGLLLNSLASGYIFRWCSITSLGIPGICDGCQANTSTLAQMNVMSASFYLSPRSPTMWVVWAASLLIWMVFTGKPSLSEGCTRGAEAEPHWCEVEGVGSWSLPLAVPLWATTRTWSFSNAETPAVRPPWILMSTLGDGIFMISYR
jgi:hypothetical protein